MTTDTKVADAVPDEAATALETAARELEAALARQEADETDEPCSTCSDTGITQDDDEKNCFCPRGRAYAGIAPPSAPVGRQVGEVVSVNPENRIAFITIGDGIDIEPKTFLGTKLYASPPAAQADEQAERDREVGRKWREDSSLETWFPITAEELKWLKEAKAVDDQDGFVIDRLARLLAEISVIVNGPEPAGTKWSYHDLPAKVAALAAAQADDAHAFKNFHRSLCARFGYVHDDVDWRRDQVSLEEHIAKMAAAQAVDLWQPIETAPKSVADGSRIDGVYLLGFIPDVDAVDPASCIDVIWWEPLLPNVRGGRGKWVANRFGDACEVAPTHWRPLPVPPIDQQAGKGVDL